MNDIEIYICKIFCVSHSALFFLAQICMKNTACNAKYKESFTSWSGQFRVKSFSHHNQTSAECSRRWKSITFGQILTDHLFLVLCVAPQGEIHPGTNEKHTSNMTQEHLMENPTITPGEITEEVFGGASL